MGAPVVWTAERIVATIVAWHAEHGRAPSRRDWNTGASTHPAGNAVYRRFGSWGAALQAAGFEAPTSPPRREGGWSRETIVEAIETWSQRFGAPPTLLHWSPGLARRQGHHDLADLFEDERPAWPTTSAIRSHFESFGDALRAAGYKATQTGLKRSAPRPLLAPEGSISLPWTEDEVLDALAAARDEVGRWPTYDSWVSVDTTGNRPTTPTVVTMFGSWSQALARARNPATVRAPSGHR